MYVISDETRRIFEAWAEVQRYNDAYYEREIRIINLYPFLGVAYGFVVSMFLNFTLSLF